MITPQGPDFLRRELPFLTYLLAPLRLFCPLTFYTVTLNYRLREKKKRMCHVRPRDCRVRFDRPCSLPADLTRYLMIMIFNDGWME